MNRLSKTAIGGQLGLVPLDELTVLQHDEIERIPLGPKHEVVIEEGALSALKDEHLPPERRIHRDDVRGRDRHGRRDELSPEEERECD